MGHSFQSGMILVKCRNKSLGSAVSSLCQMGVGSRKEKLRIGEKKPEAWEELRCPSAEESIKKMSSIYTVEYY